MKNNFFAFSLFLGILYSIVGYAQSNETWKQVDIVPMPKKITLSGKNIDLDDYVLVLGKKPLRQAIIGADWINSRITELGGKPLKIVKGDSSGKNKIIIGGKCDNAGIAVAGKRLDIGPGNPGKRGYVIKVFDNARNIYLAGADAIGTLYACVTFAELIEKENNKIIWREADVRDWPDTIKISLGSGFTGTTMSPEIIMESRAISNNPNPTKKQKERYLSAIKKYYDWLLKRKVTLLNYYLYRRGREFKHTRNMDIIREGIEYGKDRGVGALLYAEHPFAGLRKRYPEIAQKSKCLSDTGAHPHYKKWIRCWSEDEITRKTARELAEYMKATGLSDIGFHDTDAGTYVSPAQWNDRCDKCKKRWGNDYAAATINKHKIYYDEIKKLNPDATLHFTIYPYGISILDKASGEMKLRERYGNSPATVKLAEKYRKQYTEFWKRLNKTFPSGDVTFCIRETFPAPVNAFRKVIRGRGMFTWFALMSHAWRPLFSQGACWTGTFCNNPRDVFFVNYANPMLPVEPLAVREYSWNKNTPGSRPFDKHAFAPPEQWKLAEPEGEIYKLVLPKLVRNVFGRKAAPYITTALSQNINMDQIFNNVRIQYNWMKSSAKMKWQADNVEKAVKALDKLWEKCRETKSKMGMDDYAFRRFIYLRDSLHMCLWMAKARTQELLARELAMKKKVKIANAAIDTGLEYLEKGDADRKKLLKEKPDDPILSRKPFNKWAGSWRIYMPEQADFTFAKKALLQTRREIKSLGNIGAVPKNIAKALKSARTVKITDAKSVISIDGKPDEDAWKRAFPVESFLVLNSNGRIARANTKVRILHNKNNIYFLLECWKPGKAVSGKADTAEIFLKNPGLGEDYLHFFIDENGKLKQQYNSVTNSNGAIRKKVDNSWKCPGVESKVMTHDKFWTAEIKLPADSLKYPPRNRWYINIARACPLGGEVEFSSIMPPAVTDFHDTRKFAPVAWVREGYPPPVAQINAKTFNVKTETLSDSVASVAHIELEINTDAVLNNVTVKIEGYDAKGKINAVKEIRIPRIFYRWGSSSPAVLEYRQECKQGGVLVRLISDAGEFKRWFRFGGWRGTGNIGSIFSPGIGGTKGLNGNCYFPDRITVDGKLRNLFDSSRGTIEFWFRPSWQGYWPRPVMKSDIHNGTFTFVQYGPDRAANPAHVNNSPLAIRYLGNYGRISCSLLHAKYAGWSGSSRITGLKSWMPGSWHHIACVWNSENPEQSMMEFYIDGKKRSSRLCKRKRLPGKLTEILETINPFPIQIGSQNSGWNPAEAVIDELRISRIPRYGKNFVPKPEEFVIDKNTSALFHFNGNLSGSGFAANGKAFKVDAKAGSANQK